MRGRVQATPAMAGSAFPMAELPHGRSLAADPRISAASRQRRPRQKEGWPRRSTRREAGAALSDGMSSTTALRPPWVADADG